MSCHQNTNKPDALTIIWGRVARRNQNLKHCVWNTFISDCEKHDLVHLVLFYIKVPVFHKATRGGELHQTINGFASGHVSWQADCVQTQDLAPMPRQGLELPEV